MEDNVREVVQNLVQKFGSTREDKQKLKDVLNAQIQELFSDSENVHTTDLNKSKPVRIYMDGCFDILHSGHYNALRQAKQLGDILVVGIHSDEEILKNKGPTTMQDEERVKAVKACKWVDEIAFGVPYSPTVALLDELDCHFAVHGDDMPTNAEGTSAFGEVIKAGRCKIIKRTEGISTTSLVGRLLLMTREHHMPAKTEEIPLPQSDVNASKFLLSSQRIYQFSKFADQNYNKNHQIMADKKVVYIAGSFDLFHVGHIDLLEQAKLLGDFVLVGIHDDKAVNLVRGVNYPIMNLQERVLNLLSCKYVDEIIMGAPWVVSKEMITTMHISVVASAPNIDYSLKEAANNYVDPFQVAKELNIFHEIDTSKFLTTDTIIERILSNRQKMQAVYERKKIKEQNYVQESTEWRKNLVEH